MIRANEQPLATDLSKAWNFAHVLRDDGLSYMGYTEQVTFLLFLKMADELTKPPYNRPPIDMAMLDKARATNWRRDLNCQLCGGARSCVNSPRIWTTAVRYLNSIPKREKSCPPQ